MALVSSIITDSLLAIGVYAPGEVPTATDLQVGLRWLQRLLNAWKGQRLNLVRQLRTTFSLTSGTTTVTVGPGLTVNITTPQTVNSIFYVVPGTNPGVEVPIGLMDEDAYAALSIKDLSSALPLQCFYQVNATDGNASLTFWPKVSQTLTIVLYTPQGADEPTVTSTDLSGPVGFADAVVAQLARALCLPYQKAWTDDLTTWAAGAMRAFQHRNVSPGVLGVDAALVPTAGAGYNVFSDVMTASNRR